MIRLGLLGVRVGMKFRVHGLGFGCTGLVRVLSSGAWA